MRNDELAYKTLDYIREHPEEWFQGLFFCGTQACFAGRAVLIAKGLKNGADFYRVNAKVSNRNAVSVTARDLLGWTTEEAYSVFFDCDTHDFSVLEARVKAVLNGEAPKYGPDEICESFWS